MQVTKPAAASNGRLAAHSGRVATYGGRVATYGGRVAARLPFYYGWVMIVLAILASIATSPGQTFGVSIFNPSLREALQLSHSQLTFAYMAGTLLAAFPQSFLGGLMDRLGMRRMLLSLILLLGLACVFMAMVQNLMMLFVAFLLLRMLGQGALSLLAGNTSAMWFRARLGTVAGVVNLGMAAATAVVPALILWLINQSGWRMAYALLGGMVWALLPLMLVFYRNRPEEVGQHLDGRDDRAAAVDDALDAKRRSLTLPEARRTRAFWILLLVSGFWGMIATAIFFNIVPLFSSQGLTAAAAAATYVTLSVTSATTQLLGGILADRVPLRWLAVVSLAGLSSAVVALTGLSEQTGLVSVYAMTIGMSAGLFGIVANTIWARYYGRAHLGRIRGNVMMAMVAGSSVGPFIMGVIFDQTGSYTPALWLFVALLLPLTLATCWATPPARTEEKISR